MDNMSLTMTSAQHSKIRRLHGATDPQIFHSKSLDANNGSRLDEQCEDHMQLSNSKALLSQAGTKESKQTLLCEAISSCGINERNLT